MAGATEMEMMYNWFEEYMNAYLGGLIGQPYLEGWEQVGLQDVLGGFMGAYEPYLEDIMDEYYNTAAVLGQAVPGQGFSGAAQEGLQGTMADFGAQMMTQALQTYMMPYTATFSGLSGLSSAAMGLSGQESLSDTTSIGCCFIFVEADDGKLNDIARRWRDENGTSTAKSGYRRLASWLVPKMKKSRAVKNLVRFFMVKPMIAAGEFAYRKNHWGYLFTPLAIAWMMVFELLGARKNYDFMYSPSA